MRECVVTNVNSCFVENILGKDCCVLTEALLLVLVSGDNPVCDAMMLLISLPSDPRLLLLSLRIGGRPMSSFM